MAIRKSIANAYLRLRHNFGSKQLLPHPQESVCIASLDYDLEHQEMTVVFVKRGTYLFHDIQPWLFAEFNNAGASRGKYFNLYVRPSCLNYERIA